MQRNLNHMWLAVVFMYKCWTNGLVGGGIIGQNLPNLALTQINHSGIVHT